MFLGVPRKMYPITPHVLARYADRPLQLLVCSPLPKNVGRNTWSSTAKIQHYSSTAGAGGHHSRTRFTPVQVDSSLILIKRMHVERVSDHFFLVSDIAKGTNRSTQRKNKLLFERCYFCVLQHEQNCRTKNVAEAATALLMSVKNNERKQHSRTHDVKRECATWKPAASQPQPLRRKKGKNRLPKQCGYVKLTEHPFATRRLS